MKLYNNNLCVEYLLLVCVYYALIFGDSRIGIRLNLFEIVSPLFNFNLLYCWHGNCCIFYDNVYSVLYSDFFVFFHFSIANLYIVCLFVLFDCLFHLLILVTLDVAMCQFINTEFVLTFCRNYHIYIS